ncbi:MULTISPECIES: TRAP transporter permease [Brevibacillus]|uniref:TRAP transporter permease n=1 Tax=Brevibacillus TaxID=55080 RepID=UPI000D101C4F|nr:MULTISPECIES: TRAP transporter permease [Brevibacillus]PSJ69228.1 C4-dicarboxylate ABC transporter [Brevibacillus brevis]RED27479.1 TRAP transporter 4TM/12TM fusion protein [Brevibacillus brevis]TQK53684.1 TRAP transporter 4TM/12TM fusion protein [Brevibacillus sp. AG162]VEF91332.1 Neu5Ac permease [Brevibacillus brevis]GEC90829.1 C4-dicarboxylate ABC transporter [Brevibacillus brevis]
MSTTTNMNQQEMDKLIAQYDKESATRQLAGPMKWISFGLLVLFSLYQLSSTLFFTLPPQIHRPIHLAFGLALVYLLYAGTSKGNKDKIGIVNIILALLGVFVSLYWVIDYEGLVTRTGNYTTMDMVVGGIAVVLVLEAARRVVGIPIALIATIFLLYTYFGPYMPGFLEHRGSDVERIIGHSYYTLEGILGTPLAVSSTFIFLFVLFGAFLEKTGVGEYFNDLSLVIAGRRIGGPAKVAVFSSALQGTISGSSVANVVTSGAFTIPMMKRLGYRSEFAAAVEASSSTGGQIMPPVMGAAAFLMAEFIGVPYLEIAKSAILPAILFFVGIWIMTHFEAKRLGLRGLSKEELPDKKEVLKKMYLLLPIVIIITALMMNISAERAAIIGIVSTIVVGAFRKETRMSIADIFAALASGARMALGVVAATACAGIIVGTITLTGIGLKLANGLIDLAGGQLLLTLFFTMIASLILGMGTPTTANYIITSTIAAPALIQLGVPAIAAHMFTFYFGIVADITPPVALAAFAASGIAKSKPIRTGVESTRLSIAAFMAPYIFVISPALLLINTTLLESIWVMLTSTLGMIGVGAGLIGYWMSRLNILERILAVAGGVLAVIPGIETDIAGFILLGLVFSLSYYKARKQKQSVQTTL